MKTTLVGKNAIRFGFMLALTLGLSSSALADPSSQNRRAQGETDRAEIANKAETTNHPDAPAMTCAGCETTDIREFHPGGAGGKVLARYDSVGTKHTCAHCGMGSITIVKGEKTDSMARGCAMCGEDVALCTATVHSPSTPITRGGIAGRRPTPKSRAPSP